MPLPPQIRRPIVLGLTGLGATTIYELEKKDQFPRHWMLTPRCAVWDTEAVLGWLAERKSAQVLPAQHPDQALRKSRPGRGKRKPADTWNQLVVA